MIAVLHNIRSMHNVGSILRTADAVGVEKVYMCGITPIPKDEFGAWRPQVTKTALGAEKSVAWQKCDPESSLQNPGTEPLLDRLRREGFSVYAVEQAERSVPYHEVDLSEEELKKTALVFGHEINGLSESVLERADTVIDIPMRGQKHSLNVSVAFGVVAFGLRYGR